MSHATKIKAYLESGNQITPLQALKKFGCFRLAARIRDLKDEGMTIYKIMVRRKNQEGKNVYVAQYYL